MDQLGPNLGAKIEPKRTIPRATLTEGWKPWFWWQYCCFAIFLFNVPGELWDTTFRLKLGVWTQHVIQEGLQATCEPPWWGKCEKWGPYLGPDMGGTNWLFRPWNPLGSILGPTCPPNGPKTLQEAILVPSWGDFGAILVPFLSHFGAMLGPSWLEKCAHLASKIFSQVN